MRMSRLLLRTLRDDPSDAEVDSHKLLIRAGYIRKVAAGIYSWLPLGLRALRNVEQIVREEMDRAGAQELLLPVMQPLEMWERSGRDQKYGPLMFRLVDRKETGFCLAPTAEEVIAATVAGEYSSYRDLPVTLYQMERKYRDELRPRFGLLRSREFLMKDAYSFDADIEGLRATYQQMYDAYHRVFERCGLTFRPVEAQTGEIGGDVSHEFMAVAAVGEDDFVWCRSCDYAANVEAATRGDAADGDLTSVEEAVPSPVESGAHPAGVNPPELPERQVPERACVHTPDLPGIGEVAAFLEVEASQMIKCIAFDLDGELGLALVPGNREVNPYALSKAVAPRVARIFDEEDFAAHPDLPCGYIGPDYPGAALVIADPAIAEPKAQGWVTGANEVDHHVRHAVPGRDFEVGLWVNLATVVTGDPCPRCAASLSVDRGIEVGQVFQLGTSYSEAMGARYVDEHGEQHPMVMGCYGIGVSRVVAAVVEEHHDEHGLCWPVALAPYQIHLVVLPGKGEQGEEVVAAAERLETSLESAGIAVLVDDREVSAGVKFADADLLGMPVQLILGAKGLAKGIVERKDRATGERDELDLAQLTTDPTLALSG